MKGPKTEHTKWNPEAWVGVFLNWATILMVPMNPWRMLEM